MLDDPVFIEMVTFLDTKSYQHKECNELFDSIKKRLLEAEFRTLHAHVSTFMKTIPSSKCWKQLFQLKDSLNLSNITHCRAMYCHYLVKC